MTANNEEIYYEALLAKDSTYEGTFIACVKTTGVFCRPTCRARKPKKENVEFLKTVKDAILKGYRPCKVCNPMQQYGETPEYITAILNELNQDPSLKFTVYAGIRIPGIGVEKSAGYSIWHYPVLYTAGQICR